MSGCLSWKRRQWVDTHGIYPRKCSTRGLHLLLKTSTGETTEQVVTRARKTGSSLSAVEDRKVQSAQARGIGNCSDRSDLAFPD